MTRTRAAMHALCMPRAQLALSVYSLCANSSSDIVSPRFHFRCLSTEQLRPQAPMLKLWRRRMSLFLAYVTVVVILSLTIGTSARDAVILNTSMVEKQYVARTGPGARRERGRPEHRHM